MDRKAIARALAGILSTPSLGKTDTDFSINFISVEILMAPWKELCIGFSSFAALVVLVVLVRPKWRAWQIQRLLKRRDALASSRPQGLTTSQKHVLTQKARRMRLEGLKKSAAFRSKAVFYIVFGALILITTVMILLALRQGFQSWGSEPKDEDFMIPWIYVLIFMGAGIVSTGGVVLCRVLFRKWQTWRIQQHLTRRAAVATPGAKGLTQDEEARLTQKREDARSSRLKKSFARLGHADFYIAAGVFILICAILVVLALFNKFHKG
ncbi:MAG: hypothetical protein OXN25_01480 [Candidatus Poribacteria bacterium]|nr:hypothetical protein [Candidatus Poribacteria bacterium]